jgi:hypothetical protein
VWPCRGACADRSASRSDSRSRKVRYDAPCHSRTGLDQRQGRAGRQCCPFSIVAESRPWCHRLNVGVCCCPKGSRFRRREPQFAPLMVNADSPHPFSNVARQSPLRLARLPALGHALMKGSPCKTHHPLHEVAEHVGKIPVDFGNEPRCSESASVPSGASAISHQRHKSAGSTSSAASQESPLRRRPRNRDASLHCFQPCAASTAINLQTFNLICQRRIDGRSRPAPFRAPLNGTAASPTTIWPEWSACRRRRASGAFACWRRPGSSTAKWRSSISAREIRRPEPDHQVDNGIACLTNVAGPLRLAGDGVISLRANCQGREPCPSSTDRACPRPSASASRHDRSRWRFQTAS